jgi:chromosomal replication initiator protein
VISSDRPPKEIPDLEARLISRFEWGLLTDIQPPDLETRIAILRKKALADDLEIPEDVLTFIANQIDTNIRELEGALIRVVAYSTLTNSSIDVGLAQEALKELLAHSVQRSVGLMEIQQVVCSYFRVNLEDLQSSSRAKKIALPRQIAMYLCRVLTNLPWSKIGEAFGGKDHSTVIYAHDKIIKMMSADPQLEQTINLLQKRLSGEPLLGDIHS